MLHKHVTRITFILTTLFASGCIFDTEKSSDSTSQPKLEIQSVHFLDRGDHTLNIGESLANPLVVQGTGDVTYTSSNEDIVSVDSDGTIQVKDIGVATITATVSKDETYEETQASYTIHSPLMLNAWVNESGAEIHFDEHSLYRDFYLSESSNCFDNSSNQCSPNNWKTSDRNIETSLLTLTNNAFGIAISEDHLQVNKLGFNSPTPWVKSDTYSSGYSFVKFNNTLWALGEDILKSSNGLDWETVDTDTYPEMPSFSTQRSFAAYNNKLWIIDSADFSSEGGVRSSEDGILWTKVLDSVPFTSPTLDLTVFDNKLWVYDFNFESKQVWTSVDGINWTPQQLPSLPAIQHADIYEFNNTIWIQFSYRDSEQDTDEYQIWNSTDAIEFKKVSSSPKLGKLIYASDNRLKLAVRSGNLIEIWETENAIEWKLIKEDVGIQSFYGQSIEFNNRYFSYIDDNVWTSTDHLNFYQASTGDLLPVNLKKDDQHFPGNLFVFENKLHQVTHYRHTSNGDTEKNTLWSTANGLSWGIRSEALLSTGKYPPKDIIEFNDTLWGLSEVSRELLYSTDGKNWQWKLWYSPLSPALDVPRLYSFNSKLWVIGIRRDWDTDNHEMVIRSTEDGTTWSSSRTLPMSFRSDYGLTQYDNKLWIIGDNRYGAEARDVWSSTDGKYWDIITMDAGFESNVHTALEHNNQLWVFCEKHAWRSDDGKSWTKVADLSLLDVDKDFSRFASHNNQLWYTRNGQVWKSDDGVDWKRGFRTPILLQ